MARVNHFDISGDNPEQLIPFYQKVFQWSFEKWEGSFEYWMVKTGPDNVPGINGGLSKREKDNIVVDTIEVENIDQTIEEIKANGGNITMEKMSIPGVGWFAQFEDPEKNYFGIMQPDSTAK
ncbi:MAG: VOC family protein [Spirochaetes bacterium]|nr:VOC family protein [Spirochaetota bacterium]